MKSDLVLDRSRWQPQFVTKSTEGLCDLVRKGDEKSAPIFLPSRDPGRMINCRAIDPNNVPSPKGIFLHFHGGGLRSIDALLLRYANSSECKVVSVGYRLAPENPYPSGVQDCFDVADYFVENGPPLRVLGGESAGAFLAMQTIFHLLGTKPQLNTVKALVLAYGCYSWSFLPLAYNITDSVCMNPKKLNVFRNLALTTHPTLTASLRNFDAEFGALQTAEPEIYDSPLKHPVFSPLYRRFESVGARLPPALFVVGTADPLADDTILMSAHWQLAQGSAVTRFLAGAPHAFAEMPMEAGDCCVTYNDLVKEFLYEVIRQ
ncbi:alpha/beta-hydrolase [Aspergillus piperis CBS 112811]|uniref:Alpha/beta-hydrolase n=1 Tax=Aspergillus piperis CBS 112811 TaxID=1448313 RepID=A0A8G1VGI0_9EURO|nr:alpha/beta-hydrolase [Aspergillus piperis CBS 112811]RAH51635.1 alpha/beta-hydrolase [Aspergillus piperis CBS 112811]